jgi:signal transduction histidine kinase
MMAIGASCGGFEGSPNDPTKPGTASMNSERKVNILMVDDEPANLTALEAILEGLGQNLIKASSGQDALRRLLDEDFAAILLDVQMAGMDGFETAAVIRERERSRHIPIIFLTGLVKTDEMMFKGYSAGAVDYLMKPIVPGILRAKVEVFVELAVARQKLQEEVAERARVAEEISALNTALEQKNADLAAANANLEAFGHSVSHDLQAPLRHIQAFAAFLESATGDKLDEEAREHLDKIKQSARRMSQLIADLLMFSRIGRKELRKARVGMDALVQEALKDLKPDLEKRNIVWDIRPLPEVSGDRNLLRQVWANLVGNAVKYTRLRDPAKIQISANVHGNEVIFRIQDNGAGFDMKHAGKLFGVFQRLHGEAPQYCSASRRTHLGREQPGGGFDLLFLRAR